MVTLAPQSVVVPALIYLREVHESQASGTPLELLAIRISGGRRGTAAVRAEWQPDPYPVRLE
jgi:hypothetical protein